MKANISGKTPERASYPALTASSPTPSTRPLLPKPDLLITAILLLIALVPRTILAALLDVVTDEVVYIQGGKIDLPLLVHMNIEAEGWQYNYEHPPLVKLFIGLSVYFNARCGYLLDELLAARLPSIIFGTLLVVAIYWLGRAPFGRVIALLAALCLALSPWLVYFSALAYLDMTMTALVTIAYLLLWPALQRPWLYLLVATLVGLAAASKYTAVLTIPSMLLFPLYYFLALRPRLPSFQQPRVPWRWWLSTILLAPLVFLAADPAIWPHPPGLLLHSFQYEWNHANQGHLTFIAGQYSLHASWWTTPYIIIAKISALVTLPAIFFIIFATVRLLRFHLSATKAQVHEAAHLSFLLIWLLATLSTFSLLIIVVGTHYVLPMATPVVLAGASGLSILLRYHPGEHFFFRRGHMSCHLDLSFHPEERCSPDDQPGRGQCNPCGKVRLALLAAALVIPHLVGLTTIHAAEGYASEFFRGENTTLQVAYPAYREAVQWLAAHTDRPAHIGLVGFSNALGTSNPDATWYRYNSHLPSRFTLTEVHPDDYNFPYDYLVWPMHLIQRGYTIPDGWNQHIVHTITGGNTIYCYILSRNIST